MIAANDHRNFKFSVTKVSFWGEKTHSLNYFSFQVTYGFIWFSCVKECVAVLCFTVFIKQFSLAGGFHAYDVNRNRLIFKEIVLELMALLCHEEALDFYLSGIKRTLV